MVLIDYSGVVVGNILAFQKDLINSGIEDMRNLIRHAAISTIKYYKKRFSGEYGKVVICCDDKSYWRKDAFPPYKEKRKAYRDSSKLDWHLVFDLISEVKSDLQKHFPYKVLQVDKAEADDIIATMVIWLQENEFQRTGMFEEAQPIMIVSGDHDFNQLHGYNTNIRQWSPNIKKFIERPKDFLKLINEHVATGDPGDGIPNVLSPDNCFINSIRQTSMKANRLESFKERGFLECKTDFEKERWKQNAELVDFTFIPGNLKDSIIDCYLNTIINGNKTTIWQYLIDNKMRLMMDDIDDF